MNFKEGIKAVLLKHFETESTFQGIFRVVTREQVTSDHLVNELFKYMGSYVEELTPEQVATTPANDCIHGDLVLEGDRVNFQSYIIPQVVSNKKTIRAFCTKCETFVR